MDPSHPTPLRELQSPPNQVLRTPFAHITELRDGVKSSPLHPSPGDHFNPQLARRLSTPLKKDAERIRPLDLHREGKGTEDDTNSVSDDEDGVASPLGPQADEYNVHHENESDFGYKENDLQSDAEFGRGSSPFQQDLVQNEGVIEESEAPTKQTHPELLNENFIEPEDQHIHRPASSDNDIDNAVYKTEQHNDPGLEDEANSDSYDETGRHNASSHFIRNEDGDQSISMNKAVIDEDGQGYNNETYNSNTTNSAEVQFETHRADILQLSPGDTQSVAEDRPDETNIEKSTEPSVDDSHQSEGDTALSSFSAIPAHITRSIQSRDPPIKRTREQSASPRKLPRLSPEPFSTSLHSPGRSAADYDRDSPKRSNPRQTDDIDTSTSMKPTPQIKERVLRDISNVSHWQPRREHRSSIGTPNKAEKKSHRETFLDESLLSPPPSTTPGSRPSISRRELDIIKAPLELEISALKESSDLRDTEINSLQERLLDSEKKVAEAMRCMQQESELRKDAEGARDEWRHRTGRLQKEMDSILLDAFEKDRHEKELMNKVDEVEGVNQKLQEKVSSLERELLMTRESLQSVRTSSKLADNSRSEITQEYVEKQVGEAVTKVAGDLHTVYKEKHESKVAALKKSYAARWDKRIKDIETKLSAALEENTQLRSSHSTKPLTESRSTNTSVEEGEDKLTQERAKHFEEKRVLEARVDGLTRELSDVNDHVEALQAELKTERMEKDELVATVEEWLSIPMPGPEGEVRGQESEHAHTQARPPPPPQPQPELQSELPPRSQQSHQNTLNRTIPSKRPSTSDSQGPEELSSTARPPSLKKPAPSHSPHFFSNPASSQSTRKPGSAPRLSRVAAPNSTHNFSGMSRIKAPSPSISNATSAPSLLSSRSNIMSSIEEMDQGRGLKRL